MLTKLILALSLIGNITLAYLNIETPRERFARLELEASNECSQKQFSKRAPNAPHLWQDAEVLEMFWCTAEKMEELGEI